MNDIIRTTKRSSPYYVATFPNTPEGQQAYKFIVRSNRGNGCRLVKIYRKRGSGKPSTPWRPYDGNIQKSLADRFDVYRKPRAPKWRLI